MEQIAINKNELNYQNTFSREFKGAEKLKIFNLRGHFQNAVH